MTLNELFGEFGVPLYLKIDVEGADHVVLAQLRQMTPQGLVDHGASACGRRH